MSVKGVVEVSRMRPLHRLATGLGLSFVLSSAIVLPTALLATALLATAPSARAVTFADGSTHFAGIPKLTRTFVSKKTVSVLGPTYAFTLQVPQDASEDLGRIVIRQTQGADQTWYQSLHEIRTFQGTVQDQGRNFAIAAVDIDPESNVITVDLDETVAPGETVTLILRPNHNPRRTGTYLFTLHVFPSGRKPAGQFVETIRVQIDERNRD
jgi:hypothetical protein